MMRVTKRSGDLEIVSFDKVLKRLQILSDGLDVNCYILTQSVCSRIVDGIKTTELDDLAAMTCSSKTVEHPAYDKLAARIVVSNMHKLTSSSFYETANTLHGLGMVTSEYFDVVSKHRQVFEDAIDYALDYEFDYFGLRTLEKSYLFKSGDAIIERPQHMWMRVAIGIHADDTAAAVETYGLLSNKRCIHATPTLFNCGTSRPQNSSCFLSAIEDDSIEGIFKTLGECAMISKYAGGIGLHVSNIRARGSRIAGTHGASTGQIPFLRIFDTMAKCVNQSSRRPGAVAVFEEPWHADVMDFLDLRKNHGTEDMRTRDLFIAMWIPDLFMKRVKAEEMWSLMCPNECKGLMDVHSDAFEELYTSYEKAGKYVRQVPAKDVWLKILESQIESGLPYIGFKDAVNRKNNQSNIGIIKSSNLCMEINEVSSATETAVCNLASICLPTYVNVSEQVPVFDFDELHRVVKVVVRNLNKLIDSNFYPIDKAKASNMSNRPIGVGVQGLADVFAMMRMPFDSPSAKELNILIFETIYHAALEASHKLALRDGPYSKFVGSPASKGMLQFDLWPGPQTLSDRYDWVGLKRAIVDGGLRNSLLLAPMPTASTSQICGNNECFEPFTSNLYKRKTMAGEFIVINQHLVADLTRLNLWTEKIKNKIIVDDGSVQGIAEIPADVKELYKTVWEIKQRVVIDMAADRGRFVCQSQSMNLYMASPTFQSLSNMHMYSWEKGLKTGCYYLRSKAKAKTQQFTIEPSSNVNVCTDDVCVMCSS